MHREIHDRALFAAAKLAFAASAAVLPACAFPEAPSTDGVAGGEGEPSSTEEGVSKAPAKGKPKPAPRPTGGTGAKGSCSSGGSGNSLEGCRAALKEAFPGGDPEWWSFGDPATLKKDARLASCCDALASQPAPADGLAVTEELRTLGCCHVAGFTSAAAHCTPWGPPMPPAMPRRAA